MPATTPAEQALLDARAAIDRALLMVRAGATPEDVRYRKLLTKVEKIGGRLPYDDWMQLGRECGYDGRGLSGFRVGDAGPNAVFRQVEGGDVVLTEYGTEMLNAIGRH